VEALGAEEGEDHSAEVHLSRWDAGIDDLDADLLAFAGEGSLPRHQRALEAVASRGDTWSLAELLNHHDSGMRVAVIDALAAEARAATANSIRCWPNAGSKKPAAGFNSVCQKS